MKLLAELKTSLDLCLKLCHFSAMNMKSTSKTICTLLVLVLLLNPVQVFARALFLDNLTSNNVESHVENHDRVASSTTAFRQGMSETCHEDMQTSIGSSFSELPETKSQHSNPHSKMAHSTPPTSADPSDCCKQDCSCSDSACHSFSLIIQLNPFSFADSSQQYDFNHSLYISLASGPGSPPPIV